MSETQAQQIEDLQVRVAFQEDALDCMSEQLAAFTIELQLAKKQIQLMSEKLKSYTSNHVESEHNHINNERPPHY